MTLAFVKIIKKIMKHKLVKPLLAPAVLKKILFLLIILVTIFAIVKWAKKLKKAKAAKKAAKGEEEQKKLTPKSLVKIWKGFRRQIPKEFRHSILIYQPVVVLGESGSGKSMLIDKYTDWKGQSYQFYPSYTTDPDLQIYLGSEVLVQEIPSALLNDTSRQARMALTNVWERFFRKRTPITIITLKADALSSTSPDALRKQAQMLRGKINIISRLKGRAPVRVVLTNMDKITGFQAFSHFVAKNDIPLRIDLDEQIEYKKVDSENHLHHCLEPYEKHLSRALTSMPAHDYKDLMKFMTKAPETFISTATFLQILTATDSLDHHVDVERLYLISNTLEEQGANPFATSWPETLLAKLQRRKIKHMVACALLCVLASVFFLYSYFSEREQWKETEKTVAAFHNRPNTVIFQDAKQKIRKLAKQSDKFSVHAFTPTFAKRYRPAIEGDFIAGVKALYLQECEDADEILSRFKKMPDNDILFHKTQKKIGDITALLKEIETLHTAMPSFPKNCVDDSSKRFLAITRKFLIPVTKRCRKSRNAHENTLYLLSLIYASKNNFMGKLILKNIVQWSKNLKLSTLIITAYVTHSKRPWDGRFTVEKIQKNEKKTPANSYEPWLSYLLDIERAIGRQVPLDEEYLKSLKDRGFELQNTIELVKSYHLAQVLFHYLDRETQMDIRSIYAPLEITGWIYENHESLGELLRLVDKYEIARFDSAQNRGLQQLLDNLYGVQALTLGNAKQAENFEFKIGARKFLLTTEQWLALIQSRKMAYLIHDFIRQNKQRDEEPFFSRRNWTGEMLLSPANDGTVFFTWQARIKRCYTREAYEKEVKPVLLEFSKAINVKPQNRENPQLLVSFIDERDRQQLANFIYQKSESYATRYRESYEKFYMSFGVDVNSVVVLNTVLNQMLQYRGSPFHYFLETVAKHTALEHMPCDYLNPLYRELRPFQATNLLLTDKRKSLEEYQDILRQIQQQLQGGGGGEEEEKEEGRDEQQQEVQDFSARLSSVGNLSLPIFLRRRDSHLAAAEKLLINAGIEGKWQKPFLSPIMALYDLGIVDIESAVDSNWKENVLPEIYPVLNKFPFNPRAKKAVPPVELEDAIHPVEGKFWKSFRKAVGPVYVRRSGVWQARTPYRGSMQNPKHMLEIVNHLDWLSHKLWDKDGNAQPVVFRIKTVPLPTLPDVHGYYATLAYVNAGSQSIFNFNQRPSWQKFSWEWWRQDTAKAGLELSDPENEEKKELSIIVNDSLWDFYRLLNRGKEVEERTLWQWNFPEGMSDYSACIVRYYIQLDNEIKKHPWRLFRAVDPSLFRGELGEVDVEEVDNSIEGKAKAVLEKIENPESEKIDRESRR